MLYATLDLSYWIKAPHLEAALAVWDYCERSAKFIWGEDLGDPASEKLLKAIQAAMPHGLSTTVIRHQVFNGKKNKLQLQAVLRRLSSAGLIGPKEEKTAGRPRTMWVSAESPASAKGAN
jgi:hypothetical protein